MIAGLRLSLVGILISFPLLAAMPTEKPSVDAKALLAKAAEAETLNQFDKALDLYLRSYLAGQRTGEVRDKIHDCLRQAAQTRRHRDPAFRQYVRGLPPAEALNLYAEIVEKLSTHHADKEKAKPERLFALSLQEIERALAESTFRKQNLPQASNAKLAKFVKSLKENWSQRLPATPREARAALQELVRAAQDEAGLTEPTALILEALCGACAGLDESTIYLPPSEVKEKTNEPTVIRAEMLDAMAGVGIITISRFRDTTPAEFEQALNRLKDEGMKALVLDLRGNPGGSFAASIRLAERFVPAGVLASTTGQLPEFRDRVFSSTSGMTAIEIPLVVLVDAKTMSAAEVFASAMKEQGRATLIGMATFGKGSVQSPVPVGVAESELGPTKLRSGLLVVTIAKVMNASGTPLHGAGIVPHVVEPNPELQLRHASQRAAELTRST